MPPLRCAERDAVAWALAVTRAGHGVGEPEIAILAPALLLLTFVVVQAGLWFYARSLALAAAQEGVTAGRAYDAPATAGPVRARASCPSRPETP